MTGKSTCAGGIAVLMRSHCSPDMPENEATFAITSGGVADAKE